MYYIYKNNEWKVISDLFILDLIDNFFTNKNNNPMIDFKENDRFLIDINGEKNHSILRINEENVLFIKRPKIHLPIQLSYLSKDESFPIISLDQIKMFLPNIESNENPRIKNWHSVFKYQAWAFRDFLISK